LAIANDFNCSLLFNQTHYCKMHHSKELEVDFF
jgi:hypothetical protein